MSPCGSFVLTGSEDACAYVWNSDTGNEGRRVKDTGNKRQGVNDTGNERQRVNDMGNKR